MERKHMETYESLGKWSSLNDFSAFKIKKDVQKKYTFHNSAKRRKNLGSLSSEEATRVFSKWEDLWEPTADDKRV